MSEEETNKGTEETTDDSGDGDKPEESKKIEKLRKDNERLEKQLQKKKELLRVEEELKSREQLGGDSEAGAQAPKPKKMTDGEYYDAYEKGEVNPFKSEK